jgi:hypothetical protein
MLDWLLFLQELARVCAIIAKAIMAVLYAFLADPSAIENIA